MLLLNMYDPETVGYRDQLQQARADLAARSEELAAMTNAMESLAVQLTATEATLEEQARSHQTLEDDLAQCQEDLQRSIDAYKALEVCHYCTVVSFWWPQVP